ncbi:MAG: hypothetical protein IKB04_01940 [Clostridia bacterium]|nr:hypothetical protein [Clostridia bacterium]
MDGIVRCNIHPNGLPLLDWINDFQGLGNKIVTIDDIPFMYNSFFYE